MPVARVHGGESPYQPAPGYPLLHHPILSYVQIIVVGEKLMSSNLCEDEHGSKGQQQGYRQGLAGVTVRYHCENVLPKTAFSDTAAQNNEGFLLLIIANPNTVIFIRLRSVTLIFFTTQEGKTS